MQNPIFDAYAKWALATATEFRLAPAVMGLRIPMLMAEMLEPSSTRRETLSAVTEKAAALHEGLLQAYVAAWRSAWTYWPQLMSGRPATRLAADAVGQTLRAATKPASRRLKANHRRLSRRR
jgi:hypothetical protein